MHSPIKSAKLPHRPQDWPHLFSKCLHAGDLDGILALYEPDARFVAPSGEILIGHDQLRSILTRLIDTKTRMQGQVIKEVIAGDIAVLYTDFQGTMVDTSGKTVQIDSKAIELLHRQPDGTWKLLVGDPNGRK